MKLQILARLISMLPIVASTFALAGGVAGGGGPPGSHLPETKVERAPSESSDDEPSTLRMLFDRESESNDASEAWWKILDGLYNEKATASHVDKPDSQRPRN